MTKPVLYEDNHLLSVLKPANLPVQAEASGDDDRPNEHDDTNGYLKKG